MNPFEELFQGFSESKRVLALCWLDMVHRDPLRSEWPERAFGFAVHLCKESKDNLTIGPLTKLAEDSRFVVLMEHGYLVPLVGKANWYRLTIPSRLIELKTREVDL